MDFKKLFDQLKNDIAELAKLTVREYKKEAIKDAGEFLENIKTDLERWTKRVAAGELTTEDFEWLVASKKDLIEMKALHAAGLAAIRVDQFKNSVLNLIADTVLSQLGINI